MGPTGIDVLDKKHPKNHFDLSCYEKITEIFFGLATKKPMNPPLNVWFCVNYFGLFRCSTYELMTSKYNHDFPLGMIPLKC